MASRRIYTMSASYPVYVFYKCSKCGEYNVMQHDIALNTQYTARSTLLPSSTREQKAEIEGKFKQALLTKVKMVINDVQNHNYISAGFNCSCKKCGHQEPWSRLTSKTSSTIIPPAASMFIGILVLISIVALPGWVTIPTIAAIIIALLIKRNSDKKKLMQRMEEVKNLPEESLPIISLEEGNLIDLANSLREIEKLKSAERA